MNTTILQTLQNRKVRSYLILFSILAVCGFGYYVFVNLESYEEVIDIGMSFKARRNPKLAAEIFLKRSGTEAEGRPDFSLLDHLPDTNNTIILTGSRKSLSEYKYTKLREWVKKGGSLIVTMQTLYDKDKKNSGDPLLDQLGVRQYLTKDKKPQKTEENIFGENLEETENSKSTKEPTLNEVKASIQKIFYDPQLPSCEENTDEKHLSEITVTGIETPLHIDFSTDYYLEDASKKATAEAGSQFGTHILQYRLGNGMISVLTDDWIWNNQRICAYDHAFLLWLLSNNSQKVWFLYQTDSPSFMVLLIKNNLILVLSVLLLIGLLVYKHAFRFGPVIDLHDNGNRRRLKEHIDASGMFYWRNKLGRDLLNGLIQDINNKIALHHRHILHLSENEKMSYLAKLSQIPPERISLVLNESSSLQEKDFTSTVKHLKKILESLWI